MLLDPFGVSKDTSAITYLLPGSYVGARVRFLFFTYIGAFRTVYFTMALFSTTSPRSAFRSGWP